MIKLSTWLFITLITENILDYETYTLSIAVFKASGLIADVKLPSSPSSTFRCYYRPESLPKDGKFSFALKVCCSPTTGTCKNGFKNIKR